MSTACAVTRERGGRDLTSARSEASGSHTESDESQWKDSSAAEATQNERAELITSSKLEEGEPRRNASSGQNIVHTAIKP